nr:DUF226 domain-containing protein [Borreliella garinii]
MIFWGVRRKIRKSICLFYKFVHQIEKYVTLFPTREEDEFLGMFYGFKKIRNNPFYSDYTSVCNFSKKNQNLQ